MQRVDNGNAEGKKAVSLFTIIEIMILVFGVISSISSTVKTLKYTNKYVWCFAFAVLGVVFIAVLIYNIKKKLIWLLGIGLIFIYLIVAGYGAIVCELNSARLNRLSYYKGKSVEVKIDDVIYEWDGQSVTYDSRELTYISESLEGNHAIHILVDGEEKKNNILINPDNDTIYLEITGGGTGIYLILSQTLQIK
jgi:hypothetical protein